ncbi:MAG: VWA domain-containing protein [Saprospiraceae bacterium]|nr:VWA domain-containing protein [Saprospiraceae bacterium]
MLKMLAFVFAFLFIQPTQNVQQLPATVEKPTIQIALLLDTSNSMDGLIDQAKSQLWKMVNELATTKKKGVAPYIEIALYEYGNSGLAQSDNYIRQVSELSSDLDLVSERLFGLSTNGGDEYCGAVIEDATLKLKWSPATDDLKLIFIAGNEPFTQGPVDFRKACKDAISDGIQINTIFCGDYNEGINTSWKEGADLADGEYLNIDQSQEVVHVATPFDQDILELNQKLNETYIGYGREGESRKEMQMTQDANAAEYGAANAASRASYKAKDSYRNSSWDLVDAMEDDAEILEEIEVEELPAEMQEMSGEERVAFVEEKSKERSAIQEQILSLEKEAEAFRKEAMEEMAGEPNTLDKVMLSAVREQAEAKEFKAEEN